MNNSSGVFGAAAAVRESRGLTLEEVARLTRINVNYLRAIERGEFEVLPGGFYNVSYLRQYARAVDFDERELVRAYRTMAETPDAEGPVPQASRGFQPAVRAVLKRIGELLERAAARRSEDTETTSGPARRYQGVAVGGPSRKEIRS